MQRVFEKLGKLSKVEDSVTFSELEYMAFHGQWDRVYVLFRQIPEEQRDEYASKYILSSVIRGGLQRLKEVHIKTAEEDLKKEREELLVFLEQILKFFISKCRITGTYPQELLESILLWGKELANINRLHEALQYYDEAVNLGIIRFPNLFSQSLLERGKVFNTLGKLQEAKDILSFLERKPYLTPDRNLKAESIWELSKATLLKGKIENYKKLLWTGLRRFYTNIDDRLMFVEQIIKTYRYSWCVLFSREVKLADKLLFSVHWFYYITHNIRLLTLVRFNKLTKFVLLGYVYFLNYKKTGVLVSSEKCCCSADNDADDKEFETIMPLSVKSRNFLITRAMGGIGDILMMTPGFHALKQRYPDKEIHLAIPKRFFPLFEGNDDVILKDIVNDSIYPASYHKWFNLTDCPAARVESRTAPKVKQNRIDIFACALGLSKIQIQKMDKRIRYFVLNHEENFREQFWKEHGLQNKPVIGINLYSAETYRDYPHMRELVQFLSRDMKVLLFYEEAIPDYNWNNVIKIGAYPLRQAFALAGKCDVIIAPDSAFVHLSNALNVPCIALFGPTGGKIRTECYPKAKYLDSKSQLFCVPCWRSEYTPCKLSDTKTSVCMRLISIDEIHTALGAIIKRRED